MVEGNGAAKEPVSPTAHVCGAAHRGGLAHGEEGAS